jgi:hypothetical protein
MGQQSCLSFSQPGAASLLASRVPLVPFFGFFSQTLFVSLDRHCFDRRLDLCGILSAHHGTSSISERGA